MPTVQVSNITGLNLSMNPMNLNNGELWQSINMDSFPYGAKRKRPGYSTYLGTANGSAVTTLFNWTKNDGTTFFNYRASGNLLYYSAQGTGAWTICGNGTIGAGAHVGAAVLDNTLIIGDGVGSTRHTTNGTSFTNTTLAPIGEFLAQFQGRIYIGGTSSTLFYSTTNDATNWNTSGTSDSSSFTIPGAGKIGAVFPVARRLTITKNLGRVFDWDGFSLVDTGNNNGPSSPYSVSDSDGFFFWLNRLGYNGYAGVRPQLLSNAIQPQIYNPSGSAIAGTAFTTVPGAVHRYDYLASVGDVTDDVVKETITNAIHKYDYQKNEFSNYSLANKPTAWLSYTDASGNQQLIFGDSSGQCYTLGGTNKSDNGQPIQAKLLFLYNSNAPQWDKKFNWIYLFFNPGNEAQVQCAVGDIYEVSRLKWQDIGDCSSGVGSFRFPAGTRGKNLFIRINESSVNSDFIFYGYVVSSDVIEEK